MNTTDLDTIAALSTPPGESGIAVIRMSGRNALDVLSRIFQPKRDRDRWRHRRTYHGRIVDASGATIDEVVCAVHHGPESYTGEDSVEISCHGNAFVVNRLLEALYAGGARAAGPGEYTRRAFLNGKLDLIQAEAVADLIHARSELQRQVAQEQLAGGLSGRIDTLAGEMLDMLGLVEANIDFIEEDIDTLDVDRCLATLEGQLGALQDLLAHADMVRPFHEGYRVAIAGPVNAGKSSLFNRLCGDDRAIVTPVAGTTRDVLREPMIVDGLLFMLHDTAGLRGAADEIESIGIGRAVNTLETADVVLYVVDGSEGMRPEWPALPSGRSIVAINKHDLGIRIGQADVPGGAVVVHTSAETGEGLEQLRKSLVECVGRDRLNWVARERIVLNARLISLLKEARQHIQGLADNLRANAPLEIVAVDAREALRQYELATGKRYEEGLLDTIFSRFCIGK